MKPTFPFRILHLTKEDPDQQTAKLMKDQGILPIPQLKKGRPLPEATVQAVKSFYEDDEVSSRQMPGKKDCISVKEDGRKFLKHKRLIMCNLKELYQLFKERHPQADVKFSKFASLRPKHCILANGSGTHSVCICIYHQNFKLLLEALNMKQYDIGLASYQGFIARVICESPTAECFLHNCPNCPGTEDLENQLKNTLIENFIEQIMYKKWTSTDRCSLESLCKDSEEFVDMLIEDLKNLLPHHYIAKEQSRYYKVQKEQLEENEALTICDFAENYTCIIQHAVQSYYWNNDQVTLHPFVTYYKINGEEKVVSYVIVSNHMKHDVNAVYTFQKHLITFLESEIPCLKKIKYFSDGAAQQYKNKVNVLNVNSHEEDFGIVAEWHYFATAHGKGPCEGLAGTLKRNAYLASIRNTSIRSPQEFYAWAQRSMTNINVAFVDTNEVLATAEILKCRFQEVLSIAKVRSQHAILSISEGEVLTKRYSFQKDGSFAPVKLVRKQPDMNLLQPGTMVTFKEENKWTLGEILYVEEGTFEFMVLVHPRVSNTNQFEVSSSSEYPVGSGV